MKATGHGEFLKMTPAESRVWGALSSLCRACKGLGKGLQIQDTSRVKVWDLRFRA